MYGSSLLGVNNVNIDVNSIPLSGTVTTFTRGNKFFELSNHLGNVLATISDKKIPVSANNTAIDYYYADVVTANDYYPGGMQMPARKFNSDLYRYGFNGKENDNEVKGEGNQIDYGERIYDPRAGRFLSVDPLFEDYPWYTPYQFAGNSPIANIDLDGEEEYFYKLKLDEKTGKPQLTLTKKVEEKSILWGAISWTPDPSKTVEYKGNSYKFFGIDETSAMTGASFNDFVANPEGELANNPNLKTINQKDNEYWQEAAPVVVFGAIGAYKSIGSKSVTTPKSQQQTEAAPTQQNKPASQRKAATDVNNAPKASTNKNSKDAEGEFVLYDVHEQPGKKGQLLKVGKADAERTRADGTPVRMSDSQRKARQAGYPNATATVRKKLGKTTTGKATDAEASEVKQERATGNTLPLNKEKSKKYKN
jgi:RHS repeat-associated protein